MAKKPTEISFPNLPRLAQLNSFYCGPATLQMLLAFYDLKIDQETIVKAAGVAKRITTRGMTIEEIGLAAKVLASDLHFWWKNNSSISELSRLINVFKVPVGVEWQGIFEYPDEEIFEDEDDDPGHIAVVTYINTRENIVRLADPDAHYAGKDRQFSVLRFERRWWDINEIVDPKTKKHQEVDDYHVMFIVTPKSATFPSQLGLTRS